MGFLWFPEDFPIECSGWCLASLGLGRVVAQAFMERNQPFGHGFYQWGLPSLPGNTTRSGLIMMVVTQLKTPMKQAEKSLRGGFKHCSDMFRWKGHDFSKRQIIENREIYLGFIEIWGDHWFGQSQTWLKGEIAGNRSYTVGKNHGFL